MAVAQFAREYTTVRRAEGWGSRDSAYYRALPDRDLSAMRESDVGYPSDFHTQVAGRPVAATLERHIVARGRDQTALLQGLHIPLAPAADGTANIAGSGNGLRPCISSEERDAFRKPALGLDLKRVIDGIADGLVRLHRTQEILIRPAGV